MANEFATKGTSAIPAIVGKLAKASVHNENLALIAKGSFIGIDADGTPADTDIGDETIGANGAMNADMKVRDGKSLKSYDGAGVLINSALWARVLAATAFLNKYAIWGLVPSSNAGTPDEQVDVTAGECLAENEETVLVCAGDTADLTTHITPGVSTTYHLFLYRNASTQLDIVDFTTSLSPTAGSGDAQLPNLDTGKLRRVASFKTDGSGDLFGFTGHLLFGGGIQILYDLVISERNAILGTTNAVLQDLTVPAGIKIKVGIHVTATGGSNTFGFVTSSLASDITPTSTYYNKLVGTTANDGAEHEVLTSTAQVRLRHTDGNRIYNVNTNNYEDGRNQF